MKKIFKNLRKKIAPNLFLLSILIQNIFPLSSLFVQPAYASTHLNSEKVSIDFNENNHELEIDVIDDLEVSYLVEYQDSEEGVVQAIQGKTEVASGISHTSVYMGTCSTDGCLPDDFNFGKVTFVGTDYQANFTYINGQFWVTNNGKATISSIVEGKTYIAPQNNQVTVTFTSLPEDSGSLSIEEVYLSDEQVETLGAVSNVAYDITSSMKNGTFEYDLTLPAPENTDENTQVVYTEDLSDLSNVGDVEEIVSGGDISVVGLNHFTIFIVTTNPVADCAGGVYLTGSCYATLQAAINDASTGDTIELSSNISVLQEVSVNTSLIIDGKGFVLTSPFTKTGNSNNSAIGIHTDNVTIKNLIVDGTGGVELHGINIYKASNILLDGVISKNYRAGVVVNGSIVTVNNISTSGNSWGGINVDLGSGVVGPAILTITGHSSHTDGTHIWLDDITKDVSVIDTLGQYSFSNPFGNLGIYTLQDIIGPEAPVILFPSEDQYFNSTPILNDWTDVSDDSGISKYRIQYEYDDHHTFSGYPYREMVVSQRNHTPGINEQGGVSIRAQAFDGADNEGLWSEWRHYFYDATAPAVPTLTSPADGAYVQPAGLFLDWSDVSDPSGSVTYYYQSSYSSSVGANNGLSSVIYSSNVLGSSKINASGSADNRYYWQAKACDAAGNCSDWSGPWEVNIDGTAPAQPQNLHRYIKGTSAELACGDITQRQTLIPTWDANAESDFDHYEYSSFNASGGQGLDEKILYTNELMHSWVPPVDGIYGFAVRSVDRAGNKSAWSISGENVGGSCQITYDSISPDAPALIEPANNSFSDGLVLLSDWTTVSDADHYIYESYHDENATNLRWHAEYTQSEKIANNVGDSTFWWRVKAVDVAGNESPWSDLWKVTIDGTAPTTPIMNGFLNPTLACGAITNIHNTTVDWTDSTDANGISRYHYAIDYPLVGGSGFGHWETYTTSSQYGGSLNEGIHTVKVRAQDTASNYSAWSSECTITTDWTAPDVEITAPPAGFVNGIVDVRGSVVDDNPHHYWLVIQNSSGSTIAGPGVVNDSSSFSNQSLYSWDTTGLVDGEYIIKLEARDAADNKDGGSVHWLTVKVDNTAPLVTFTGPSQTYLRGNVDVLGSVVEDNLSHYNFSIYPGGVDFNNFSLRLHSDTQYLSTGFIDRLLYSWNTTSWSDGEYLIRLAARDSVGNRDLSGDPYLGGDDSQHVREVFIDNTAPTSTITSYDLENGGEVETATFSGRIEGTASDVGGSGVDHVLLSIGHYSFEDGPAGMMYWDDSSSTWVVGEVLFKANGAENWDYQLSDVPEGVYTITSHAVDKAGNQESTFVIKIVFDKTIPEVTLTIDPASPDADNGWYKTLPTITLSATDNYLLDRIEYRWNSDAWSTYTTSIKPPGEGQSVLYYRGIDKVGNTTDIGVKEVKYDVTKPAEGPLNVKVENITLDSAIGKWEAPKDVSDITRYALSWRHESGDSNGKEVGSDVFEHKMENLYDGEWIFIVKAMDDAGNFRESSTKFTIGAIGGGIITTEEGVVLGDFTGGGTTTPVGQVAGTSDKDEDKEENKEDSGESGLVLGTEDEQCDSMSSSLPWILLVTQFILMILARVILQKGSKKKRNIVFLTLAVLMPGIFYFLRNVNCYSSFIYNLFILPSLAVTLFSRLVGYFFIKNID